jgi:hypothetical protein
VRPRRLLVSLLALVALVPAASAQAKLFDVNNDRRQDLVVGLPDWETRDGQGVVALYVRGAKRGLLGRVSVLTRNELGVPEGDSAAMIGTTVTSADFDGDDFEDLAFGSLGSVVVAYGSRGFPPVARTVVLRQSQGDTAPSYGDSLIAGDLNGENVDDLVVGPEALDLHFGKMEEGVTEPPDETLVPPAGAGANFGFILAHGDVSDDGHAELFQADGRHVAVAFGREQGPRAFEWVAQGLRPGPESLAIGDVDGDLYGDLVAGVPQDGAVKIWWGGPEALSAEPMTITQASPGVPGTDEGSDRFGSSVAVGKLDRDRYADIVVGAPGENNSRGRVTIVRGGPAGYARTGNRSFKRGDRDFGTTVGLLDFNGDDHLDLSVLDRRGVTALRGTRRGISLKRGARLKLSDEGVVPGEAGESPVLGRPGSSP